MTKLKASFKKDTTKKYACSICGEQFNWNDKTSSWYGKLDEKPEAYFCGKKCRGLHKPSFYY
jgi:transcription initiation factor IIE alpha subunit